MRIRYFHQGKEEVKDLDNAEGANKRINPIIEDACLKGGRVLHYDNV